MIADEMGLGKTVQAIAAMRFLILSGAARSVLIVAPSGLTLQWRKELKRWAPGLRIVTHGVETRPL